MEYIGIDVHQRESQLCIIGDDGRVVLERRVGTSRDRLAELLGERGPARVLLEASTDSEWVAQALEALGLEVIVADPNFAAMYATRSRRVKTDRRDARTLGEACRLGAYRPAHRTSAAQRTVRAELAVYDGFEFRNSDTDFLDVGGIVIEQYEAFTQTTNASGVTTYEVDGDQIRFEHFFESHFLEGTEVLHHVKTNDPPDSIGPDVDETFVRDPRGEYIFVSRPRYELDGGTLRLIDEVSGDVITLHRAGS